MGKTVPAIIMAAGLALLVSCGERSAQDKLVGTWEAPGMGRVEFKADGSLQVENEPDEMTWELVAGEPMLLRVIEGDDPEDADEVELVFQSDDEISLIEGGETMVLKRIAE